MDQTLSLGKNVCVRTRITDEKKIAIDLTSDGVGSVTLYTEHWKEFAARAEELNNILDKPRKRLAFTKIFYLGTERYLSVDRHYNALCSTFVFIAGANDTLTLGYEEMKTLLKLIPVINDLVKVSD